MNYKLYQIHLTDAEVDKINAEGHNSVPKHKLKLDMSFCDNVAELAKAFPTNWEAMAENTVLRRA